MKQSILFGIVGLVVGGLLTYTVTANTVNKTETSDLPNPNTAMQHGGESTGSMSMSDMMDSLEGKKGDEFDKAFISSMIVHHEGAIDMAKEAQISSDRQEIKDLADNIIKAQTSEIEMMQQWQKDWGFTQ
jgi:uncharacterized protein (DUF305 family)